MFAYSSGVTAISTDVNMDLISNLVNIEIHRYYGRIMAKSSDPDIQLLAALADPTRLEILRQLAGSAEVCACDFTECCGVSQPTVSHHLKVLRDAGIVTSERRGSWVFYRIAPNLIERLGGIARSLVPGGLIPAASLLAKPTGARARAASVSPATA
jgi:ArsR family transcriptional regulator, arsenate/arsenite/antimonite-responsive transcriptional repressor